MTQEEDIAGGDKWTESRVPFLTHNTTLIRTQAHGNRASQAWFRELCGGFKEEINGASVSSG